MISANRAGAAAGLVGAVLYIVGAFVAGSPPAPDASTVSIVTYMQEHREALLWGMVLTYTGLALFLWFAGYLHARLAAAEAALADSGAPLATVTLLAFVVLFGLAGAGGIAFNLMVWRGAGSIDPNLVRLAFDAQNLSLYAITSTVALLSVLAPIIVIARTGILPKWLVVLGALEIAVNIVEIAGFFSRSGWNAGGYAAGIGPLVWVVWLGAVSITMLIRTPAPVARTIAVSPGSA